MSLRSTTDYVAVTVGALALTRLLYLCGWLTAVVGTAALLSAVMLVAVWLVEPSDDFEDPAVVWFTGRCHPTSKNDTSGHSS